jgi:MoaA/NifB/PqqE/SkfB family radical SAM enzyme
MFNAIDSTIDSMSVIWDLGRRCTYSCSYCGPVHSNKWSKNTDLETLKYTIDGVVQYLKIYNRYTNQLKANISFTGGEPTVNPWFFDFVDYIYDTYPHLRTNVTTNGCYNKDKCQKIIDKVDTTTVSYHPSATDTEKFLVRSNIDMMKEQNYKFKVNLMFHKDYFDECVDLSSYFKDNEIAFTPRMIGDSNSKEDIAAGYTHVYTPDQYKWFQDFWNQGKKKISKENKTNIDLGRPCCAGICMQAKKDSWQETKLIPDTNFQSWYCMVNWRFLYINSEIDAVYHHQTCNVNLEGQIGPIGKASEFSAINKNLEKMFAAGTFPVIRCPKIHCGCGLCAPKAKDKNDFTNIFKNHVADIEPILPQETRKLDYSQSLNIRLLHGNLST